MNKREPKRVTITQYRTWIHSLVDKVIVVLGPRGTGKTTLIKNGILNSIQDIPMGFVFNGTEDETGFYSEFVPTIFVFGDCDQKYIFKKLDEIKTRQKEFAQLKKDNPKFKNIDNRLFIVIDDFMFDDAWLKTKLMRYFFMNGRHIRITLIIASQYVMGVPKAIRSCIDYVFICAHSSAADRKCLYENYAAGFSTLKEFNKALDSCTQNYKCMVIRRNSTSRNLSDQVWWYKAPETANFRMCHPIIWDLNGRKYDEKYKIKDAIRNKNTSKYEDENLVIQMM